MMCWKIRFQREGVNPSDRDRGSVVHRVGAAAAGSGLDTVSRSIAAGLGTRDTLGAWGRRPMSGSSRTLTAGTRSVAPCVGSPPTSRTTRRHTRSLIFIWTITHRARGHRRRGYQPPSVDALPFCRASVMTSHRPATGAGGVRRDCFWS